MKSLSGVQIFSDEATEERGENARLVSFFLGSLFSASLIIIQSSFVGAIAVGDLVKSTLGPKGMVRANI